VFVAAVWIVTSGLSLDRSETSVVPGGEVTGPAETGPAVTGPTETEVENPGTPASGESDVVRQEQCSDGARSLRGDKWKFTISQYEPEMKVRVESRGPEGQKQFRDRIVRRDER
jgi:hypothetical protein